MKSFTKTGAWVLTGVTVATTAFIVSCGGGSGGDGTAVTPTPTPTVKAATLDVASVKAGIPEVSAILPICSSGSAAVASLMTPTDSQPSAASAMLLAPTRQTAMLPRSFTAASTTRPADSLGSCGGRMTYTAYSHLNGVTTATRAFENYCSVNSTTGERQITNGVFSFVNTGTPTANGPVTTRITASSNSELTLVRQDASGKVVSSQGLTFSNYVYTVGVPGGDPTQANPSSYGVDQFTLTDKLTNKSYRQTGYKVTYFDTPSGGQQYTMSGRGYRSNGDYFDLTTKTAVQSDSSGRTLAGAVVFTGANGTAAVATLVPGSVMQATMTVNGTPVTGLPACK